MPQSPAAPFEFAPPPTSIDGLTAVPIDISQIDAVFEFDAASRTAKAEASLEFRHGVADGCPVFDLRQTIRSAWLDGSPVAPEQMAALNFDGEPGAELRILERRLAAHSEHSLRIAYDVGLPQAPAGGSRLPGLNWHDGDALSWNLGMSDLSPGRYLEAWVPANLIFDQYSIDLGITVASTTAPHTLITNGRATEVAPNRWWVEFRATSTALSPMIELHPSESVEFRRGEVWMPVSRKPLAVEIWKPRSGQWELGSILSELEQWLPEFELRMGPYPHGSRFVVFLQERGGMEYDGGCTTSPDALWHETHHAWWARGLKPASQRDGWIDEAWTVYSEDCPGLATPIDWAEPAPELNPSSPWHRSTPRHSYKEGRQFFEGLAHLLEPANLAAWMDEFCRANTPGFVTTAMLEDYLTVRSGNGQVRTAFNRLRRPLAQTPRTD